MNKDSQEVFRMMGELGTKGPISEAIGDNTVDNMMDELTRSTNIELGKFVSSLLNTNINLFLHSYNLPQYEEFRSSFRLVLNRYQVMDGSEQGDLFRKIENMFKDIFISKFGDLGPEVAEVIAQRYAVQMVDMLKKNSVQANVDLDQDREGVYY
jgi:hypothetical protein